MFELFVAIASTVFYYRVGCWEYRSGWLCAALSLLLSAAGVWLEFGLMGLLGLQVLLFAGLTAYNAWGRKNAPPPI